MIWTEFLYEKSIMLDHQANWEKLSSQTVSLPGFWSLINPREGNIVIVVYAIW